MSELVKEINEGAFDSAVLGSSLPALVDFWAPWCGPCRMLGPVIEEIAGELSGKLAVFKINVDDSPELAGKGGYWLIPDHLHAPLEQGFIITRRAQGNALAQRFADYMGSQAARAVMTRYGFVLPGEAAGK